MQIITLGIGTPSDIPHFILFGLSPTGPVDLPERITAHAITLTSPYADGVTLDSPTISGVSLSSPSASGVTLE